MLSTCSTVLVLVVLLGQAVSLYLSRCIYVPTPCSQLNMTNNLLTPGCDQLLAHKVAT